MIRIKSTVVMMVRMRSVMKNMKWKNQHDQHVVKTLKIKCLCECSTNFPESLETNTSIQFENHATSQPLERSIGCLDSTKVGWSPACSAIGWESPRQRSKWSLDRFKGSLDFISMGILGVWRVHFLVQVIIGWTEGKCQIFRGANGIFIMRRRWRDMSWRGYQEQRGEGEYDHEKQVCEGISGGAYSSPMNM